MENDLLQFSLTTRIVMGRGSSQYIAKEISELNVSRILIVTDRGITGAGILDLLKHHLKSSHLKFTVFLGVEANPTTEIIAEAQAFYERDKCQGILAIGGGSSIDTAKGVSILATNGGKIEDYIGANRYKNPPAPLVAIPTTVSTGSEATWALVMTIAEKKKKVAVVGSDLFPRVAILDPELLISLPPNVTAATGMDALSHAVEGYVSLRSNPISDALHRHAIYLIAKHLRPAVANSLNFDAMGNMLVASTMAGIGITNSNVGLVHAMSHPVSAHFGVSHGDANAILLPHVMRFNWIARVDRFADIAALFGEPQGSSPVETARYAPDVVEALARNISIPSGLAQVGVEKDAVETLANEASQLMPFKTNPRRASLRDVVEIYMRAM